MNMPEPHWKTVLRDVSTATDEVERLERELDKAKEAQRARVCLAWNERVPVAEIAESARVAVVTVRKWAKAAGLPLRK